MKNVSKMTQEDLRWQTDADVSTLERYAEILADSGRLARAKKAAMKKSKELKERASELDNISK